MDNNPNDPKDFSDYEENERVEEMIQRQAYPDEDPVRTDESEEFARGNDIHDIRHHNEKGEKEIDR